MDCGTSLKEFTHLFCGFEIKIDRGQMRSVYPSHCTASSEKSLHAWRGLFSPVLMQSKNVMRHCGSCWFYVMRIFGCNYLTLYLTDPTWGSIAFTWFCSGNIVTFVMQYNNSPNQISHHWIPVRPSSSPFLRIVGEQKLYCRHVVARKPLYEIGETNSLSYFVERTNNPSRYPSERVNNGFYILHDALPGKAWW